MYVDVGATSREEVENVFGIHIGDPMMPDVTFEYDAEHEICFGKHLTTGPAAHAS